jgi:ABC-type glycerol-3-phosphate transport system substrate-binding protein
MNRCRLLSIVCLAAGLVATGCANLDQVAPGTTAAALEASRGKPSRIWNEPDGGFTWEYPMGPAGRYTYMARIDKNGRVTRVDQVLGWDTFAKLENGMTTEQVEHLLGRPYSKARYPLLNTTAWAWRFVDGVWYRCFLAYFNPEGRLTGTGSKDEETGDHGYMIMVAC